jgi:hypothetical protein
MLRAASTAQFVLARIPAPHPLSHPRSSHALVAWFASCFLQIMREEGVFRLYRGFSATVAGAIPSHAVHFATYENLKQRLGGNESGHHPLINGMSGGVATMAHDAIVTPLDVVKQRLQVRHSAYAGVLDCIRTVFAREGLRAFYASYPTTVAMNVPFQTVHFAAYESFKIFFTAEEEEHGILEEFAAGGAAGALAGFVSTPLDVVKTRLQTQIVAPGQEYVAHNQQQMGRLGSGQAPRFEWAMLVTRMQRNTCLTFCFLLFCLFCGLIVCVSGVWVLWPWLVRSISPTAPAASCAGPRHACFTMCLRRRSAGTSTTITRHGKRPPHSTTSFCALGDTICDTFALCAHSVGCWLFLLLFVLLQDHVRDCQACAQGRVVISFRRHLLPHTSCLSSLVFLPLPTLSFYAIFHCSTARTPCIVPSAFPLIDASALSSFLNSQSFLHCSISPSRSYTNDYLFETEIAEMD